MTLIEFIGFVISLAALIFLSVKRAKEEHYRKKHPERFRKDENTDEANLKQLLKSMNIDLVDGEQFSPPKPLPKIPTPVIPKQVEKPKSYIPRKPVKREQRKTGDKAWMESHRGQAPYQTKNRGFLKPYEIIQKKVSLSKGGALLSSLPSKKEMVILFEILDKPKGLR